MEKQNPHQLGTGTGCENHRADEQAQPNQNTAKKQPDRSRYVGTLTFAHLYTWESAQ